MNTVPERLAAALADRYRIERELGAGGMATVYLAEDLKHRRRVAVKVLRPELSAVLGAERFLKEIELTASLQHPHLLPLFDSGEAVGLLYYVMPYVEGESLRARLTREHQMPIDEALRIITQVAGALAYAHRQGVIHRDIKPENILLHEGQALVADFGIALALREAAGDRLTQTGLSLGTPQYMSPEQAAGDSALDARTDVYSLACVLYELLAGQPPHTGPTVQAVIARLMADVPRPVTALRPTVPSHVDAALEVALAKLPADRFSGAAEFAAALASPDALSIRRPTAASRAAGAAAPSPWRVRSLAAAAVLATALAVWGWAGRSTRTGDGEPVRLLLALRDPPPTRMFLRAELSPDGRKLAYPSGTGWRILDLRTGANTPASDEVRALLLKFSPTGDSVALNSAGGRLAQTHIADLATGRASLIAECCFGMWHWDDDGWIYHRDIGNNLVRTHIDGRHETLEPPARPDSWGPRNAYPVPGGRGILYVQTTEERYDPARTEIVVKDVRSGAKRVLGRGVTAIATPSGYLLFVQADGTLMASRFDLDALQMVGNPAVILDGLRTGGNATGGGTALSYSRNGTLLVVPADQVVEDTVLTVDREGGRIAPPMPWGGMVESVVRSADGRRWAASVNRAQFPSNIWVRTGGEPARRITFSDNLDYTPVFLPGGDLAFTGSTNGRNWDLYRVPFDGSTPPQVVLDREGDIQFPRFSTDGRWVVFCDRSVQGQVDIVAHRFGPDSQTVSLVATPGVDCQPDISPDGRWLAYRSNETGAFEIYVRPFDARAPGRWQVSRSDPHAASGGASLPRWSPDGRELFFGERGGRVMSVPVTPGARFAFGPPRLLFSAGAETAWAGDVLPDGRGFLLLRRPVPREGHVLMIQHVDRLLREKLGG